MLDKILILIDEKQLNQDELERQADLPKGRISKWKKGQGEISARQALRIARVLGVSLESLVDDARQLASDPGREPGEEYVLRVYRDLKLTSEEAVFRLGGRFRETTDQAEIKEETPPSKGSKKAT